MTLDARTIAKVMGGDVNGDGALVPGPGHSPKDRSLSVKPTPGAKDGFIVHSFAGDGVGECRDHVKDKLGIAEEPLRKPNGAGPGRRIINTYDYFNEHRELLFQAVRYEPKGFSQRRPDSHGEWVWNLEGVRRVPYRLPDLIKAIAAEKDVVIVEGEKDVEALRGLDITATTCSGGAGTWRDDYNQHFKEASVVIIGDNDEPGRSHAGAVAKALAPIAARVRLLDLAACWPECPPKGDISDWLASGGTRDQLIEWINRAPEYAEPEQSQASRFKPLTLAEFFSLTIKPRGMVLDPIIPEKGLAMVYAVRGTGKTYLVNLADPKVQAELAPHLDGVELLILDNLSSLTAVIRDNDADSWNPIQAWLLRLRRRGISVLIVHHAGKGGEQRGTSRREDVLDTSISLRRPSDYVPTEGARFEVHLEKARGVHGEPAKPFEAKLEERGSTAVWTMRDIDDANLARVRALLEDGLSVRDIADETGIPKSTVQRLKKKIEGEAGDAE
jgi:Homeodomain-like domain